MHDEKGKIEELNESLNSRTNYHVPNDSRSSLAPEERSPVDENWETSPNLDEMLKYERRKTQNHPVMRRVFILALAFFVCALFAAVYIFLGGKNFISSRNVEINIRGPVYVNAGDVLDLEVSVLNKNNADLETATLTLQYPDGTRSADDASKSQSFLKEDLGALGAGKEVTKTESAILFGTKGEVKEIKASLDYKIKGSNATFTKEKLFEVTIGSVPVTMTVSDQPSVVSGEAYTTTITLVSNSPQLLQNVIVRGEYPYGFTLLDSSPSSISDSGNVWAIGDMIPGAKKVITLKGKLLGEDNEERTFRYYVGIASSQDAEHLDTTLSSVNQTIALSRPAVQVKLSLNGDNSDAYIAPPGKIIQGTVTITNNSPRAVVKNHLEAKLSGDLLDRSSVQAMSGGFYNSQTNTIVWDGDKSPDLKEIAPGESALFSFMFSSITNNMPRIGTPEIGVSIAVSGESQGSQTDRYSNIAARKVKLASLVTLISKALYSRGPFQNDGPMPPRAEKETTYTAVLDVGNTQNDLRDARVTATLGQGVTWVMPYSKESEDISYDESAHKVTWNLGTLASGTGFGTADREVAFQLRLAPSLSQVSSVPVLVTDIRFTGTDTFTNQEITVTNPALTTSLMYDPAFIQGDEVVVK